MNVALSGKRPLTELYDLGNDVILPKLQSVNGVADVQLVGGLKREIQVKVDSARLRAYGLSLQQVSNALERENVNVPGGRLTDGTSSVSVRTSGLYRTVDDLKNATIVSGPGLVRLQDVATRTDTYADRTQMQRFDGQDAVGFRITKQSDANGVQVSDDLRAMLDRTKSLLPRDVTLQVTNDTAIFTRRSLDAVLNDLKIAVILTALVLLVFLHTWRRRSIVLLAIPTSLISTFVIMYYLRLQPEHVFADGAGADVSASWSTTRSSCSRTSSDTSQQGEPARQAALIGRSEIGLAAIAITLVDVVVYLPVSFMTGNIGRLFREFGITIAAATLFSLFISFTLTPMLASRFLKHQSATLSHPAGGIRSLLGGRLHPRRRLYRRSCSEPSAASDVRWWSWCGADAVRGLPDACSEPRRQRVRAPGRRRPVQCFNITTPPGTSLAGTDAVTRVVEERLQKLPEVQRVFTSVGVLVAATPPATPISRSSSRISTIGSARSSRC